MVGAGYATLWAVAEMRRKLSRQLRSGEIQITVIAPKNYHSFHGWTAEAVSGVVSSSNRRSPLRRILRAHRFILGKVVEVDTDNQTVKYQCPHSDRFSHLPYDQLVIANGSYDSSDRIPGLKEFGYSPKAHDGVEKMHNVLINNLELADSMPPGPDRDAQLTVVVAGGGFTGVELVSNIAEMFRSLEKYFPVLKEQKPRIVLVHSGDELLPVLQPRFPKLIAYTRRELDRYGIEVLLNTKLEKVRNDEVELSTCEKIATQLVVTTVGQMVIKLAGTEDFVRTNNGLVETDEYLRVKGYNNVWAAGDAAAVPCVTGGICPSNALWAIHQGRRMGNNIARVITMHETLRPFKFRGLGQAASLGVGKGVTELYGIQLTGWIGWIGRLFAFLYVQPSSAYAVRLFFDWVFYALFGRYMTSRPR